MYLSQFINVFYYIKTINQNHKKIQKTFKTPKKSFSLSLVTVDHT